MAFEATAADRTPRHGQDGCRWGPPIKILCRGAPVRLDKQIDNSIPFYGAGMWLVGRPTPGKPGCRLR
jgi:hypothetical protein